MMTMEQLNKKDYAIMEAGIDLNRLTYFAQHQEIVKNADIYKFPDIDDMTKEQYDEYVFSMGDLVKHYKALFICNNHSIVKFVDNLERGEVLSSVAQIGANLYGTQDLIIHDKRNKMVDVIRNIQRGLSDEMAELASRRKNTGL